MMSRRNNTTIYVPEDDCEVEIVKDNSRVGTDNISVFCCSDAAVEEGGK